MPLYYFVLFFAVPLLPFLRLQVIGLQFRQCILLTAGTHRIAQIVLLYQAFPLFVIFHMQMISFQ